MKAAGSALLRLVSELTLEGRCCTKKARRKDEKEWKTIKENEDGVTERKETEGEAQNGRSLEAEGRRISARVC